MISVIIPIYNIENYLRKCLDSLANQTFSDVEFIVIDDGSTDNSGRIADSYTDPRFRVFHTRNNGISAARNYGIEKSRGEWIMLVDGDDWVEPDFCEMPYKAAMEYNADLVIFGFFRDCMHLHHGRQFGWMRKMVDLPNKIKREKPMPRSVEVVDTVAAVKRNGIYPWNKLYKRELFNSIRYPEGRVYEDVAVTHRLILASKRTVMLSDKLYHYVNRKDGISHNLSVQSKRDGFVSAIERGEDLKPYGCYEDHYSRLILLRAIAYLAAAYPGDDPMFRQAEEVVDGLESIPEKIPVRHRIMILLWKTNKNIFHLVCRGMGLKDNS